MWPPASSTRVRGVAGPMPRGLARLSSPDAREHIRRISRQSRSPIRLRDPPRLDPSHQHLGHFRIRCVWLLAHPSIKVPPQRTRQCRQREANQRLGDQRGEPTLQLTIYQACHLASPAWIRSVCIRETTRHRNPCGENESSVDRIQSPARFSEYLLRPAQCRMGRNGM